MFKQFIQHVIFIGMSVLTSQAHALSMKESEIKAAFLYNLGSFMSWPATSFNRTQTNFNICILGQDPFNQRLEWLTRDKLISNHPISVNQINSVEEAIECHILFFSESEQQNFSIFFKSLEGKPVLTVSDIDNFILRGGMLQFFKRQDKIRLALDPEAISEAGLKASAHLMKVVELIRSKSER